MPTRRGEPLSASGGLASCTFEPLEGRRLFALARPDHVVVVIEQDRASDALGNPIWSYLNQLASTGLVYTNGHGVAHPSEPNTLALYSGSTQGITDNGRNHSFAGPNLARSLFNAGLSFSGFVENLPSDGSQVTQAGNGVYPDLYTRNLNAMAQFTDIGIDPLTGRARPNAAVNRTFAAFAGLPTTDYAELPTVSFIIPSNLHNAHGSNEMEPWAGSPDEENNDVLRKNADDWLRANLDAYLQWAKVNNSLLIVTQDEERWTGGSSRTVTTVVNGDPDLFNPGTNGDYVNHYNLLRTITDMYGLAPLGVTGSAAPLDADASGQLAPDAPPAPAATSTVTRIATTAASTAFGQTVTFTASVVPGEGSVMPTGLVTFKDGATTIGTGVLNASGTATLTVSTLGVGSHAITAVYGGSATFIPSSSPTLTQTVGKASSTTTLTSSSGSAAFGQSVTLTAVITGQGGTVTFFDGATSLATVAVNSAGRAVLSTSSLSVATHAISAVYGGAANHFGSESAPVALTVSPASTSVMISASANPSATGQPVTFAATVAAIAPGAGTPNGTVQFLIDGLNLGGAVPVVNGVATSPSTASLPTGSYVVRAVYSGSATYAGAVSGPYGHVVSDAPPPPVPAPTNRFADRTTLTGAVVIATGTNVGATRESREPLHAGNDGGKSVWWTWTAPATGTVTMDTVGSNYDTLLAVYTGTTVSALTRIASNDDGGPHLLTSKVTFAATAGQPYQIAIDGYYGLSGNIVLRIHMTAQVPAGVVASDGTSADAVRVRWNPAVAATAYEVWRASSSSGVGATKISLVDVAGTTFDDATAVAGQAYWYFVKAKNPVSTSALGVGDGGYRVVAAAPSIAVTSKGGSTDGGIFSETLFTSLEPLFSTR